MNANSNKFKLNDNGTYSYSWTVEDLLNAANEWLIDIDTIGKIEVCKADSDYLTFRAYRSTDYEGYNINSEYNMMEDDIVYLDIYNNYLNFSNDFIVWVKVDNLQNEELEILYLPQVVDNELVHSNINRDTNLFYLAQTQLHTSINEFTMPEIIAKMINPYTELITYEDHLRRIEEHAEFEFNLMREFS